MLLIALSRKLRHGLWAVLAASLCFGCSQSAHAIPPLKTGAVPGQWTEDYDAALALAKEKQLPIMLYFTGGGWCPGCIQMESNVFTKAGWTEFAQDSLVLVALDFPAQEQPVKTPVLERNIGFATKYQVESFPTFVVLSEDAQNELGRVPQDYYPDPASFIKATRTVLRRSLHGVAAMAKVLPEAAITRYREQLAKLQQSRVELRAWMATEPAVNPENNQKYSTAMELQATCEKALREIEVDYVATALPAEKAADYRKAYAELVAAEQVLETWLRTAPDPEVEANRAKYRELAKPVGEKQAAMQAFE